MIFESIELKNLFSYYGTQTLDLTGASTRHNIVLISGRNGFGKTGFLNSMKLLFTGVNDALLEAVQGRKPSVKQYVRGAGDTWFGIMNQRAYNEGQTNCSIKVYWHEKLGRVSLSRSWNLANDNYKDKVELEADFLKSKIFDNEVRHFLDERISTSFIPFYFFDGEQVQRLAAANRTTQMKHIEQLLNIARIESLLIALQGAVKTWHKNSMNAQEKCELKKIIGNLEINKQNLLSKQEAIEYYENKITSIHYKTDEVKQKIKRQHFADYRNHTTKNELQDKHKLLEESIEELQQNISRTLTRCIPLLANTSLLENVTKQLDIHLQYQASQHNQHTIKFLDTLPDRVFNESPPEPTSKISLQQCNFYTEQIRIMCEEYLINCRENTTSNFPDLSQVAAKGLLKTLTLYGSLNHKEKYKCQLQDLQDKHHNLAVIAQELDNLVQISPEEKKHYRQLKNQEKELDNERIDAEAEKKKLDSDIAHIHAEITKLETASKQQAECVRLSNEMQQRKKAAEKLQDFFRKYKQTLKEDKRSVLEQAINKHFSTLMTSHHQIAHIAVREDFSLHYLDKQQNSIAMGNISAGMKQIVATALLWALKDVSNKNLPMIIDTPLARIDMNHQYHLLQYYYPKVAKQIILLPTDSEIDAGKYTVLKPYIYREYCLRNTDGDNSYFEQTTMCWKTE